MALELENPALAAAYLLELATLLPADERAGTLAEAGKWTRASGDGAGAADCYRQAVSLSSDPAEVRVYAAAAIDALEAQDQVAEAADLAASYSSMYKDDIALLERAAALASGANHATVARDLGRRLVLLRPDDEEELVRQVHRELAADDPRSALPFVQRVVGRRPLDPRWREVLARVAEWAGAPSLALENWLWLLERGLGPSPDFQVP
jgi:predicted Zn-dependent protease